MTINPIAEQTAGSSVFIWYLVGVLLRRVWHWMDWVQEYPILLPNVSFFGKARLYWKQQGHISESIKDLIVSIGLAFIWTLGLVWALAGMVGWELPGFGITPLSSIAAGLGLKWLVTELVWPKLRKLTGAGDKPC